MRRKMAACEAEGYTVARLCSWMGSTVSSSASPIRNDNPPVCSSLGLPVELLCSQPSVELCSTEHPVAAVPSHEISRCGNRVEILCRACVDAGCCARYV